MRPVLSVLLVLAAVGVVLSVIGVLVEVLLWTAVLGVMGLALTAALGGSRRR